MSQSFAIMGAESVCAHLIKVIPEIYRPYIENNCILYEKNGAKTLIAPLFKFGNVSNDEIAKIWRYAQTKGIDKIYLLARAHQRSGVQLANCLKGDIEFVQPRSLHKFLIKHNALPQKNFKYKKASEKLISRTLCQISSFAKEPNTFYSAEYSSPFFRIFLH